MAKSFSEHAVYLENVIVLFLQIVCITVPDVDSHFRSCNKSIDSEAENVES